MDLNLLKHESLCSFLGRAKISEGVMTLSCDPTSYNWVSVLENLHNKMSLILVISLPRHSCRTPWELHWAAPSITASWSSKGCFRYRAVVQTCCGLRSSIKTADDGSLTRFRQCSSFTKPRQAREWVELRQSRLKSCFFCYAFQSTFWRRAFGVLTTSPLFARCHLRWSYCFCCVIDDDCFSSFLCFLVLF